MFSLSEQDNELQFAQPMLAEPHNQESFDELARVFQNVSKRSAKMKEPKESIFRLEDPDGVTYAIPKSMLTLLSRIIKELANGNAVTVVPFGKELTTQQAADILNVSRQYLVRLLERGDIPFNKVGTHRRLQLSDVLAYRKNKKINKEEQLRKLSQLGQELLADS